MLTTYLKIALRNLAKNKTVSFINIFGLGLSMSVGLMILIRVQDAFSYDSFHKNRQRIYRVTTDYQKNQDRRWHMASTSLPMGRELAKTSSSIENVVTVYPAFSGKAFAGGKELSLDGVFTETSFFKVFDFSLLAGSKLTALENPNSMVLSKDAALRFFGNANALGKVLSMQNGVSYVVTGVLNEPPAKSHLTYDAYVSLSTVPSLEASKQLSEKQADWYAFSAAYSYVLIKDNASLAALQGDLNAIAAKLNNADKQGQSSFALQSLRKISPGSEPYDNDNARGTSWTKMYIEVAVALLVLLAACFNYTNLTIARALTRAKEVGIRKIAGAKRYQIYLQYLVESLSVAFIALSWSAFIVYFIVRYAPFNDDYEFIPSSFRFNGEFFLYAMAYAIFTGLLAGAAPAKILSAFKPLRVLKNLQTAKMFGKVSVQKTLVVFQYSLSLLFIIFLSVFYQQFSYMGKADPGFIKDNTMIITIAGLDESVVTNQIKELSGVQSVASFSGQFTPKFSGESMKGWIGGREKAIRLNYYFADQNFVRQMDLGLVAGQNFPAVTDSSNDPVLVNETAARMLGFTRAEQAVGQKISISDSTHVQVAGVLKDFTYEGAGRPIYPLAIRTRPHACNYLYIRTESNDKQAMESKVKAKLAGLYPNHVVKYDWLDDALERTNSQMATISLLGYLGFIALTVATLGLLGLVMYTVEVRAKEISIRKVVGASEGQLVKILSAGFIKLLLISGLIALPIGWFLGNLFLQGFAERFNFSVAGLLACFLFLLVIGLFTIVSQTYRAAVANPAGKLRSE